MYAPTSTPFVRRTRATFRSAEFGLRGVFVYTRVQTPRFCGAPASAGLFVFALVVLRPLRTSWFTVGTFLRKSPFSHNNGRRGPLALPTGRRMVPETRVPRKPRNPTVQAQNPCVLQPFSTLGRDRFSGFEKGWRGAKVGSTVRPA